MSASQSAFGSQPFDAQSRHSTPIHYNDQLVGFLVEDAQHRYRFAALDEHFDLLDGSRFMAPHGAFAAIARLSRFIDRPLAANEA